MIMYVHLFKVFFFSFPFRLKEENRRLLQEKQENEQMIQLLETEKEVLSINVN